MLILNQRTQQAATDSVALVYDDRKRSRLKVTLASGAAAGIFLERGDQLRHGDKLAAEDGSAVVEIQAAPEQLVEAATPDALLFARAAYHLGNRHGHRFWGLGGHLIQAGPVVLPRFAPHKGPEQFAERAAVGGVIQVNLGVLTGSSHLGPVAHDARVGQELGQFGIVVGGNFGGDKTIEYGSVVLPLF